MSKRKVHLAQVNHLYGRNCFLPYSAGMLWAYAVSLPEVCDCYELDGFTYLRGSVEETVIRMPEDLDVLAVSCYIWNSAYSHALAKMTRERFPNCLIVMGGPHVPNRSEGYFMEHPFVDLLVHGEGEVTFAEVLKERSTGKPDYVKVKGLSINVGGEAIKTAARERIDDLNRLPSPYLTGLFDRMANDRNYAWNASSESHRGCPFSCSFCDWGSNTMAKLKQFPTDRMIEDYEWMARNEIEILYNCDANYGIFARDVELTERMIAIKEKYGYPQKFRAAYAKNSNDRVFQVSKMLNDAGMSKGTTLSFQSMDEKTLETIRRKNIAVQDFKNLMNRYRDAGIPTYSEMICGLPGETYDSWADGFAKLLNASPDCNINCYSCEVLPNAELADPAYRELHGIRSVGTPVLFFHASAAGDGCGERYEIVTSTGTMPPADWIRSQLFAWIVQACHCLGLTQKVAVFLKHRHGIGYREFYEWLIDFALNCPDSSIGRAYDAAAASYGRLRQGKEWGFQDKRFGDVIWPVEEGGALSCMAESGLFYEEQAGPLLDLAGGDPAMLDVLLLQKATLKLPTLFSDDRLELGWDLPAWLDACYRGEAAEPKAGRVVYAVRGRVDYGGDLERWAREIVWFGRKGGSFFWEVEKT